jgi:PAS domain S-box-containing protein
MSLPAEVLPRYRDLQAYVGWSAADAQRVNAVGQWIGPIFPHLVEDFYQEIERHPNVARVITGGQRQVDQLKCTLLEWLAELFRGPYDDNYVARRWRVGRRHVEIGLPHVYAAAAMSRLRNGIFRAVAARGDVDEGMRAATLESINKLMDLDLAVISDAYERSYVERQREAERRQLSEVLHREKEFSARLLAHAQAAILVLDRQGRIARHNAYFETLVDGFGAGPIANRDWFEFLAPTDRHRVQAALLAARTTDGEPVTAFSTLECPGRTRHLHWSGVPLNDTEGLPFAVLVIGHDVSDLHDAQQRALQAGRLAAIGQMATGLAHESRSALQRIGASAEMLEMELEGKPAALELVARIQQSQRHLHQLLDDVRNYAAPTVLDRSPFRISEAWREAWELLAEQRKGRAAELCEHIAAHDLIVEADRYRLVQVFRNLLDNALGATPGSVRIEVACQPDRIENADAIRVCIWDSGPGLTTEQRRRFFEPFFTTKPTGTGLGTAIVQRLVEAHGGTVAIGQPPSGTEVSIVLPRHPPSG